MRDALPAPSVEISLAKTHVGTAYLQQPRETDNLLFNTYLTFNASLGAHV